MSRHCLVFSAVILIFLASAAAKTIHVPADQPTVQAGIDAASSGDTVLVSAGTYYEQINFSGKNIAVRSASGKAVTTLDGGKGTGPVVRLINGETSKALLKGFTIQNGSLCCFPYEGGGVEISNASPSIIGNLIRNNVGAGNGGGINVNFGSPIIKNNVIAGNSVAFFGGTDGGGIYVGGQSSAQIIGNKIKGNFGVGFGGGIGLFAAGNVLVLNNTITGNTSEGEGGGIDVVNEADELIVQNVIANNSSPSGAQVYMLVPMSATGVRLINNTIVGNANATDAAVIADGFNSNAEIINNIILANGTQTGLSCNPIYKDGPPVVQFNDSFSPLGLSYDGMCAGFGGSNGNNSADPALVSVKRGNYRLLANSPAIDAGTNSTPDIQPKDFAGKPRIVDGNGDGIAVIDMGAYEFQ